MQTSITLILIDSNFAAVEEKAIVDVKIMTKLRDDLDSNSSLKLNDTVIEPQENDIYLRQISQSDHLQLIQNINIAIINSRCKIRFALISKEQHVTQRAREAYVACQNNDSETIKKKKSTFPKT
jgi:hypothetical protein